MRRVRPAALGLLLLAVAAPTAQAQVLGGLGEQNSGKPIGIEAEQGIEWQQNNHVYIARGHVKATRGDDTLYADTVYAYYRPAAARPPGDGKPAGASDPLSGGSTEIYRLEADGDVRLTTPTQAAYGDHAVYDVDHAILVLTGKALRLTTPRDIVTARESIEWYDRKQMGVARGDAVAVRDDQKRIRGDVLTAYIEKPPDQPSHLGKVVANGKVVISSPGQIGRGDDGVYNADTGVATLSGHVSLTKDDNELRGEYAVVDLNNNVSRLLAAPPNTPVTQGNAPRVEGLLVPRSRPDATTR